MRPTTFLTLAAAPFALAGAAAACNESHQTPAPPAPPAEVIDLVAAPAPPAPPTATLVGDHDDHHEQDIRVEIRNGEVLVWVDGEKVDPKELNNVVIDTEGDNVFEIISGERKGKAIARWNAERSDAPAAPDQKVQLGVVLTELSGALAEKLHLDPGEAVLIQRVLAGTAADKAGLKANDVLIEFDDEDDLTVAKLRKLIGTKKPGDKVEVEIIRDGDDQDIEVVFLGDARAPQTHTLRRQIHGRMADQETEKRFAEALEKAEQNARKIEREWNVRIGDGKKHGHGKGLAFAFELDAEARAEIERAMATLQDTLAEHDFDFDLDLELEDFPRMRFIETQKAYDKIRREAHDQARQLQEKAIVLEHNQERMQERAQRLIERHQNSLERQRERAEHAIERQRERAEHHIERLEGRIAELEGVIEQLVEKLEAMSEDRGRRGIRN